MNIDQALKKIGEITEKALEKDPNAITWDDEINIKRSMVNGLNLEKYFSGIFLFITYCFTGWLSFNSLTGVRPSSISTSLNFGLKSLNSG